MIYVAQANFLCTTHVLTGSSGGRVAVDIFNGSAGFHRNERCSLAYNKEIFIKISMGLILEIRFLWGVACHSAAVGKNLARSGSGRQSSQGFTFTVNSAPAVRGDAAVTVPERLDHQT